MSGLYNLKKGGPIDWVEQRFVPRSFAVDGGTTTISRASFGEVIPEGARWLATHVKVAAAFTGDTSAAITIGDGTDVDRYNTSTLTVSSAGTIAAGAASGTLDHAVEKTPVVTLTTGANGANVSAGDMTIRIMFVRGL